MTKIQFKLSQIALALVVAFGALAFSACGADESKAPLVEWNVNALQGVLRLDFVSQDDETIITKVTLKGRNGMCKMDENFGAGTGFFGGFGAGGGLGVVIGLLYGEKITYGTTRTGFASVIECPPKNGTYEIEIDTNFGTFEYEIGKDK